MTDPDDWTALINNALGAESGDIPAEIGQKYNELGTGNPNIYKGSSDTSPESPKSPLKKHEEENSENLDGRAGNGFVQLNCDKKHEWVTLIKASSVGYECDKCDHLHMKVFARVKDRRLFHWRCAKGFAILETQYAGERVHIAPADCNQYQP